MPYLHVLLNGQYDAPRKTQFMHALSQAVVDSLGVPLQSVRVHLLPLQATDCMVAGVQSAPVVHTEVHMIAGRSKELKAALLLAINRAAHECLGVSEETARTVIYDLPSANVGMAKGISAEQSGR